MNKQKQFLNDKFLGSAFRLFLVRISCLLFWAYELYPMLSLATGPIFVVQSPRPSLRNRIYAAVAVRAKDM